MAKKKTKQWSESDYEYLTKNISQGTVKLSAHFGVSLASIRSKANLLGLSLKLNKAEIKPIKETKMDNGEQFDKSKHKIKNNSTAGKIPFKIPKENMTVYICPKKDSQKYREEIIKRYANRHKPIT
jgi:hypothetical protein